MSAIQSAGYQIFFDDSLLHLQHFLATKQYTQIFLLLDSNTENYCLPLLKKTGISFSHWHMIKIAPGEANKTIDTCISIWKTLIDFGADRDSLLINFGGGVLLDMGSFVASTFKRGIDFIQIPTTLLAQADAAVGTKTGVNLDSIKNMIGTFTAPAAVFINRHFLKTLDQRQLRAGLAEMMKHALVYDASYFEQLQGIQREQITTALIYHSVEIKNELVRADPFEKNRRKILNFGHTIGHAIESYSLAKDAHPLLHGEAIVIGFICEGYLSTQINGLRMDALATIQRSLSSLYPKYDLKKSAFPDLIKLMRNDKKNQSGHINCSLLSRIGQCSVDHACSEEALCESLAYYMEQ